MLVSICDYSEGLNKSSLKVLPLVEQLASILCVYFNCSLTAVPLS